MEEKYKINILLDMIPLTAKKKNGSWKRTSQKTKLWAHTGRGWSVINYQNKEELKNINQKMNETTLES
jgi:hypothetical protein